MHWHDHIEINPKILTGKPVVKGTRIAVELIISLLAQGWSESDVLASYPQLRPEDIRACLLYAGEMLRGERVYPTPATS